VPEPRRWRRVLAHFELPPTASSDLEQQRAADVGASCRRSEDPRLRQVVHLAGVLHR